MRISTVKPGRVICPKCGGIEYPVKSLGESTYAKGQTRCREACASFVVKLDMDPPTTTHHAKKRVSYVKGGKLRQGMADSERLEQVIRTYTYMLRAQNYKKPPKPLLGLLQVHMIFSFRGKEGGHYPLKPDDDNLCKTLQDVLVKEGWITADQMVCRKLIEKRTSRVPFVQVAAYVLKD